MTREEHLNFCKKCLNRKMDLKQGLLCKITDKKADFTDECKNFKVDDLVKVDGNEPLGYVESMSKITERALDKLRLEQNFQLGLISGIIVGIIGAILWGAITVATGYQIGYMAIAIGAGVGFAMRFFGKGVDPLFGILAAIIAVLSCALGNFFSIIGFVANSEKLGYIETFQLFDYSQMIPVMAESFNFMDILFYGFAAYEAHKFSFRVLTEDDLKELERH